jgi:hypothetical protein
VTNFSDIVKCYRCKEEMPRMKTLILETPKGRFRICRDCYAAYSSGKLNEDYKGAKEGVKLYGVDFTDAYDIIKKKEKFIQNIKEGRI